MSALQNTVCWKVRNSFSHKIEQPQKVYKKFLTLSKHANNFNNWNHVFNKYGKFILIEQLNNVKNTSTEVLK